MLTFGFFKIHRGILKYFKKPYSENEAWIWMISQAEYRNGDKRSRVSGTMRQFSEAWGVSRMQASRWLTKWGSGENPRISCQYARFGGNTCYVTEVVTEGVTGRVTAATEITLLNYDKYQGLDKPEVTGRVTGGVTASGTLLKKEEKKKKEKKKKPDSDESVSPNSQVYNFYVEEKRRLHNIPTWKPNATQAKQLRANIKVLIEKQGFSVDNLLSWLRNFFSDEKIKEAGWPWKFFMTDPIRWKIAREPPATPPAHRKWDPKNERM